MNSLIGKAKILELIGSYAEAATIIQEVISMKEKVFSQEVPMHEIEDLKVLLAKLFCIIGLPKDAKDSLKDTGERICQIFGSDETIYFANSLLSLADLHKVKAKFDIANTLYKKALDIKIRILGENHLTISEIYSSMSENMRLCGNLEYADVYCQQALTITAEAIGNKNIQFTLLNFLQARILCDMGKFDASEKLLLQCKQEVADILGTDSLHYAYCLGIYGDCLRLQGKFTASSVMLSDSLALFKKSYGSYHNLQGEVMMIHAMLMMDLDNIEEAEILLVFKILGKIENVLGVSHPLTILTYGNIDLCKSKAKVSLDAMSVSPMQSIASIESAIPTTDIDTLTTTMAGSLTMSKKSFITRNSISYSIKETFTNIPAAKCISTLKKRRDLAFSDSHPFIIRLKGTLPKKNREEAAFEEAERQKQQEIEEERARKLRGLHY